MKEESKFKVGDRVYAPYHGYGIVTKIHDDNRVYPIEVTWNDRLFDNIENVSTFTVNGSLVQDTTSPIYTLTVVESAMPKDAEEDERMKTKFKVGDKGEEVGQIAYHSKGFSAPDKEEPKEGKAMTEEREFKVGDRVWSFHFGVGIVESVSGDNMQYPIAVKWTDNSKAPNTCDYFTKDGEFDCENPSMKDIAPLEIIDHAKDEEDTGVVDRMMDALDKKTDEAVNQKHYHVEGIPEAIYLMTHLMNKEQLEGFIWGNIVKYAYRYGRKGDKAETAGKIAWYAKRLEEVLKGEHNET